MAKNPNDFKSTHDRNDVSNENQLNIALSQMEEANSSGTRVTKDRDDIASISRQINTVEETNQNNNGLNIKVVEDDSKQKNSGIHSTKEPETSGSNSGIKIAEQKNPMDKYYATRSNLGEQQYEYDQMMRTVADPNKKNANSDIGKSATVIGGNTSSGNAKPNSSNERQSQQRRPSGGSGGGSLGSSGRRENYNSDNSSYKNPFGNDAFKGGSLYGTKSVFSGGNTGSMPTVTDNPNIRVSSERPAPTQIRISSAVLPTTQIRTDNPENKENKDIRQADEHKPLEIRSTEEASSGLKTRADEALFMMSANSSGTGSGYVSGGKNSVDTGVYVGGKTGGMYRKGSNAVLTNYAGIFSNPQLAKRCGVTYNPTAKDGKTLTIAKGRTDKITEATIARELMQSGYSAAEARKYAQGAMQVINGGTGSNTSFVNVNGAKKSITSSFSIGAKDKIEIRKTGDTFAVYKPIGVTKTDVTAKVDRHMQKVGRTTSQFTLGMVQQGTGEAGEGLGKVVNGLRFARLFVPSVSVRVNKQFQKEMENDLKQIVMLPMKTDKGTKKVQLSVDELKTHLIEVAHFDPTLVNQCRDATDFQYLARRCIKEDKELSAQSINKYTDVQRNMLEDMAKSRPVTKQERMKLYNETLNKYGVFIEGDAGHNASARVNAEMQKAKKIYGDDIPEELKTALKGKKKLVDQSTYENATTKRKTMQIIMMAKQSIEKNGGEAGQGLSVTTRVANLSKMLVTTYAKVFWAGNMLVRAMAQQAMLYAARTQLLAAKAANKVGLKSVGNALTKSGTMTKKGAVKFREVNKKTNNFVKNAKDNAKKWIKDHNPLTKAKSRAKNAIGDRIKKSKWFNKFNDSKVGKFINRAIGRKNALQKSLAELFRKIGAIKQTIIRVVGTIVAVYFAILLLICIINSVGAAISSLFNINSQTYDAKQYLANDLKTYFEDDMRVITDLADELQDPTYDPVDNPHVDYVTGIYISYEDYKDYDKYVEKLSEHEGEDFIQSSNNGEIMSMALIRYNHDLGTLKDKWFSDDPKKSKQFKAVEEYMQQLYYGSHSLSVRVELQTFSSEDVENGEIVSPDEDYEYTKYTIYATYKTYYFDYLFNCPLLTSPQREVSEQSRVGSPTGVSGTGDVSGVAQSWDAIYCALRNNGISHNGAAGIMSNMAHESGSRTNWRATNGPNPTAGTPSGAGAYGICQWTSSGNRKANMIAWCESQGYQSNSTAGQLAYMLYEINEKAPYSITNNAVYSTSMSAYDIANKFGDNFEIYHTHSGGSGQCGNTGCEHDSRGNLATTIANYYSAYQDDWSSLYNKGEEIADIALSCENQIHYTQGTDGYVGARTTDLSTALDGYEDRSVGTDCSGFVAAVHKEAGITGLPGTTAGYYSYASKQIPTSQVVPGDVVWKSGHVGIVTFGGATMELKHCYFEKEGECVKDCSSGSVVNFTCGYRFWD